MISRAKVPVMAHKKPGRPSLTETETERVLAALDRLYEGRFKRNGTALAEALGRTQPGIAQLRGGVNKPSLDTARRVARLEGVPVTNYLDETADVEVTGSMPEKQRAAQSARLLRHPEWAIEEMLNEPVPETLTSDPGALFWFRRIEMLLASAPQATPEARPRRKPISSSKLKAVTVRRRGAGE